MERDLPVLVSLHSPGPAGRRNSSPRCAGALLFALLGPLPPDAASALGGMLARRIGPRLGVSNRARRNLRSALPELSATQIEAILRGMWDNLGRVAAEYPHLRHIRVFG